MAKEKSAKNSVDRLKHKDKHKNFHVADISMIVYVKLRNLWIEVE